jgi:Prolyl oligopeptidase, N-terminal beta-propeller domain
LTPALRPQTLDVRGLTAELLPYIIPPLVEKAPMKPMKTLCLRILLPAWLIVFGAFAQGQSIPKPPDTPKHAVTDEYHGVKVIDDYRWLENWDDPAVKQWSAAENARTRAYLDICPIAPLLKSV